MEADPENALSGAIAHICVGDCTPVAGILDGLEPELMSIFREAGARNLRLLHRLVVESCRLYRAFTPEMRRDSAFLRLALTHLAAHGLIEMRVKDVLAYAKKYLSAFQLPRHSRYDGQDSDCRFEDDCSHGMIFLAWDMLELETIKELVKEKLTGADHALAVDSLRALVRDLEQHPEDCRHDKIRELTAGEEFLLFEAVEPMRIVELIDQVPAGQRHLLFNHVLRNYTRQHLSEAQLDAKNSRLLNNWISGFESGLNGLCSNKGLSPLRCEIYDEMAATAGRFKSGGK